MVMRYVYPFGNVKPRVDHFADVIYKSPYDLRTWKPNEPPAFWWHTFAVERPAGVPIVASVIDDQVFLYGDCRSSVREQLLVNSPSVSRDFGSVFGEILYFAEGERVTFAAFSHTLATEIPPSVIDPLVENWLEHYVEDHALTAQA